MAARRLRDTNVVRDGDELVLLFTDTMIEDEDLYRFLGAASSDVDGRLEILRDGRTPWELFNDEKFIGNTRVDICSRVLKRDLARKWVHTHCDPDTSRLYMGIDWSEAHRHERAAPRWLPYIMIAPLIDPPLLSKDEMIAAAKARDIEPPRLYKMGFPHNNCGGFCVKQGQAAFLHLLKTMPDRFDYHEQQETAFRERTGKDVAILRDRRGGTTKPLTLKQLRVVHETVDPEEEAKQLDLFDWGGCGCMVD
jgi:hypothetical protein